MSKVQERPAASTCHLSEQSSMLNLLMQQQSQLQRGIKLTFAPELQDKIAFEKTPYHYCAVSGKTDLAALLYSMQVPFDEDIKVAKFAADGSQSTTPWSKTLSVTPADTARMAGHTQAAKVLEQIEAGVPLHWDRTNHHLYPSSFRHQARMLIESLASSSAIATLPGAARVSIVNKLMTKLAQELVWSGFSPAVWKDQWEECVGLSSQEAQELLGGPESDASSTEAQASRDENAVLAAYQFTIRDNQARHQAPVRAVLLKIAVGTLGGLLASHVVDRWGFGDVVTAGACFAGVYRPASTTLLLGIAELVQRRGRRH